ncbi:Hypothetical predicted protein [Mytilus galloprovincialis]|uniref:Uncharacterized protein n=1 Tax=Mytilus galloprovincialis TaxID=29158 RepID=A0A8B6D944_MYTGA|nr:Hypothetical predicted protein [Mytilus galloprovincialis]
MAAFKALGSWLEDSGWTSVLVNAQVTSPYVLRDDEVTLEFEDWCLERSKESPHFKFWYTTLRFELTVLIFIRSIREANFSLYIEALSKIIPWFFALDHTNYSRWLPIHLCDMVQLPKTNPETHRAFLEGNFVVNKTKKKFSCMAIDQAHEQNNACVKADGGAVGLTENLGALRRWMVAGPEMARLVNEFENVTECFVNTNASNKLHHEQTLSFQESFRNDIVSLYDVIDDLGNPFLETKRLVDRTTSVFDTIKRNKLPLFQTPPPAKKTSTTDHKLMALKSNCSLFSRLYIACQSRDGNLDDFFRHENHAFPPSLSQNGTIRLGTKADLLSKCLERLTPPTDVKPVVSSVILDGSAVVNMLKPVQYQIINEYALKVFIPYIQNIGKDVQRIDIVFDTYIDNSLKASTRGKRGKGIRRRVQDETNVPGNWQEFLRLDENKIELFHFLADKITSAVANPGMPSPDFIWLAKT